jgi:hypothetical protein
MNVALESWPVSLSGGPLKGDRWVRHIYIDESGTSPREKTSVVAAVIVDVDKQWRQGAAFFEDLKVKYVPEGGRKDFVFHCSEILRGEKPFDGPEWPHSRRLAVICEILRGIGVLGLPTVLTWFPNNFEIETTPKEERKKGTRYLSVSEFAHMSAFASALCVSDKFIADHCDNDIASVVAEDHEQMRTVLLQVPDFLKGWPEDVPIMRELTNIINDIQFHRKKNAPFLQFADAASFCWRSYLSGYPSGDMFKVILYGDKEVTASMDYRTSKAGTAIFAPACYRPT